MKYSKVYHQNCRVAKAYVEITEDEFDALANEYEVPDADDYMDEEGNIDYDKMNKVADDVMAMIEKAAASDDGFNYGDFHLYARDDDFDMYDIQRQTR